MKLALIKSCLYERQRKIYFLTFDYLIASLEAYNVDIEIKVCYSFKEIKEFKPDIVGISSVTESFMEAKKLATKIKQEIGCYIIIGGVHITALPQTLPKDIDIAVLGEGENTLVELLNHIEQYRLEGLDSITGIAYWKNNQLKITESRKIIDINKIPIPLYKRTRSKHKKVVSILTGRGCINRCIHCCEQKLWKPFRYLSGERLAEIIEAYYKETNATQFNLISDVAIFNLKNLINLRDHLKKKNLLGKIQIIKGTCNSELITEDILKIMKELGCYQLSFGTETASPNLLTEIKQGRVKVSDFINCIELCNKYNIRTGGWTMWGYPGETKKDMEINKEFLLKYNGYKNFRTLAHYICQPLPGSLLWDKMYQNKKVSLKSDFSQFQIVPNLSRNNWFYSNSETVERQEFISFILDIQREIRLKFKNGGIPYSVKPSTETNRNHWRRSFC